MASVLELCPFCNSPHLQVAHQLFSYAVSCQGCKARGPSKNSFEVAVVEWNNAARMMQMGRREDGADDGRTQVLEATIRRLVSQLG